MKTSFTTALLLLSFLICRAQIQHYKVDVEKSTIKWQAKKVIKKHGGTVNLRSGHLTLENGKLASGHFVADMETIVCTDINNDNSNENLVTHLNSEDFFFVKNFKTATFVITRVIPQWENNYQIIGKISIKNISKNITFNGLIEKDEDKLSASAIVTLDRTEFDIRHGSGQFFKNLGDHTINDHFILEVTIQADAIKNAN